MKTVLWIVVGAALGVMGGAAGAVAGAVLGGDIAIDEGDLGSPGDNSTGVIALNRIGPETGTAGVRHRPIREFGSP